MGHADGDESVDGDDADHEEGGERGEGVGGGVHQTAEEGADGGVADVAQNGTQTQEDQVHQVQAAEQEVHHGYREDEKLAGVAVALAPVDYDDEVVAGDADESDQQFEEEEQHLVEAAPQVRVVVVVAVGRLHFRLVRL